MSIKVSREEVVERMVRDMVRIGIPEDVARQQIRLITDSTPRDTVTAIVVMRNGTFQRYIELRNVSIHPDILCLHQDDPTKKSIELDMALVASVNSWVVPH